AILGVTYEFHETPGALVASLDGRAGESGDTGRRRPKDLPRNNTLTLIDTPGFSPSDTREMHSWANALQQAKAQCHLVVPAPWGLEELDAAANRFAVFSPRHLALTHLDQCETPGRAIALSVQTGCPVSLLSFGPSIPEDLEAASNARLVDLLVGQIASLEPDDPVRAFDPYFVHRERAPHAA
ncbi:MAG: hypothetical protein K2Q23_10870, partial [Bryobacteraceae bacterium]|nr:hypothetical protein [Bryobacteraceae bacterium]